MSHTDIGAKNERGRIEKYKSYERNEWTNYIYSYTHSTNIKIISVTQRVERAYPEEGEEEEGGERGEEKKRKKSKITSLYQ